MTTMPRPSREDAHYESDTNTWRYKVVALSVPVIFNKYRDYDPNGLMYALAGDKPDLEHQAKMYRNVLHTQACEVVAEEGHPGAGNGHVDNGSFEHGHTVDPEKVFQPHVKVRPLVLRACVGDKVEIEFTNHIREREVGIHLIGPGYGISSDGSKVGAVSSLAEYQQTVRYTWKCEHEGVFPFHDIGDPDGDEDGTNAHGLFGALIVEPEGTWWTDSALDHNTPVADGLYVDVHYRCLEELDNIRKSPFAKTRPPKHAPEKSSFREYVLFLHDEPEVRELKRKSDPDFSHCGSDHMDGPCFDRLESCHCEPDATMVERKCDEAHGASGHSPQALACTHNEESCAERDWLITEPHGGSLMCFNYRSEPMKNREQLIWQWLKEKKLKKTVINEEQHHSSWMFGDPATPVLKAYLGDPVRIRLIHAGVKETHVFHLHVYEWYADPDNHCTPLIDAITITPGTGHTIVPLFGAGNLQVVPGDVIWHCHLYPHFHMGMWGMFRTFDTLQEGKPGKLISDSDDIYANRRIGLYPDGTPIEKLAVLPDRMPPPKPTPKKPGFPLFIAGEMEQKSPVPPWPEQAGSMPLEFDYRPAAQLEISAMNSAPKPGELFTYFPHPDKRSLWLGEDDHCDEAKLVVRPEDSQVNHDIAVARGRIDYNSHGWHDPDGHFYYLGDGTSPPKPKEPLFFRARQGDVLNLTFTNAIGFRKPNGPACAPGCTTIPSPTEGQLVSMHFDLNIPPCDAILANGETHPAAECGLHVHMVKFDPICADGASTGWNYMSAPSNGKKMVYRWWCDEEFGVIFCHDHLFANTRQRHGLFGSLLVEPEDSQFFDPVEPGKKIVAGQQALIERQDGSRFREFCIGGGDWIAMYDRAGRPLEVPEHPSSHEDNGTMCVNYRCAPLKERGTKPESWFKPDKDTIIFDAYPNETVYLRVIQGSHEEQHSFQIHGGLRWRRFRKDIKSPIRSQQTLGLSEAFTFIIDQPYPPGDYLWRFGGAEDTWLGCWGLVRVHNTRNYASHLPQMPLGIHHLIAPLKRLAMSLGIIECSEHHEPLLTAALPSHLCRRFKIEALGCEISYRDNGYSKLVDPQGLAFVAKEMAAPGCPEFNDLPQATPLEPLILRCRQGEWVEIEITNNIPSQPKAEKHPPELPLEEDRNQPPISNHVSLDCDLLVQWARNAEGTIYRPNPIATVPNGTTKTFLFHADIEPGPVLLQDLADVRNHRHHGLFGTLIVEPADVTPMAVEQGKATAPKNSQTEAWSGSRATLLKTDGKRTEEIVLIMHDGIRYYKDGVENAGELPIPPDIPGDTEGAKPDTEDQGQKAFNYRSERLDLAFESSQPRTKDWFTDKPATPVFCVPVNKSVVVRFICAADKPRNHSFTIHGHAWREWPHQNDRSPVVSSEGGLSCGSVRSYEFLSNQEAGDYIYRSGVLKWAVAQGLWGILRIV
jgi:manganese oxidase